MVKHKKSKPKYQQYRKDYVVRTLTLTHRHREWLDNNHINFSRFVRDKIDEEISKRTE